MLRYPPATPSFRLIRLNEAQATAHPPITTPSDPTDESEKRAQDCRAKAAYRMRRYNHPVPCRIELSAPRFKRVGARHREGSNGAEPSQTRLIGPGSLDQSRPSASQTWRTERGSSLWSAPTSCSSAVRPKRWIVRSPMTFSPLFTLRIEATSVFGQPLSEGCIFHRSSPQNVSAPPNGPSHVQLFGQTLLLRTVVLFNAVGERGPLFSCLFQHALASGILGLRCQFSTFRRFGAVIVR